MRQLFRLHFLVSPCRLVALSPLSLFFLWTLSACASSSLPQAVIYPQKGDPIRVSVEVADTPEKQQFGLMYRYKLPEFQGMLFLFPSEAPRSFWMKNTPLPLDIIFINAARTIVSIARQTTPFSTTPIPSDSPAQFVLEVNGGFCQRHSIAVGDRVELPGNMLSFTEGGKHLSVNTRPAACNAEFFLWSSSADQERTQPNVDTCGGAYEL